MKKEKELLLPFNVKNKNGRIYTKESIVNIDELLRASNSDILIGECLYLDTQNQYNTESTTVPKFPSIQNVSHLNNNIEITDEGIYGDVKMLDTKYGNLLKELYEDGKIVFRPQLTGTVNENGVIENCNIISFDAIFKQDDAFNL